MGLPAAEPAHLSTLDWAPSAFPPHDASPPTVPSKAPLCSICPAAFQRGIHLGQGRRPTALIPGCGYPAPRNRNEQVASFVLVSDLRFLGKMSPLVSWLLPHRQIKPNKVKKVVIWKSLVAKGSRGMRSGRDGAEMLWRTSSIQNKLRSWDTLDSHGWERRKFHDSSLPEIFPRALFFLPVG